MVMAALLLSCVATMPRAWAEPPPARAAHDPPKTHYEFDDDTVEGGFARPEDSLIDPRLAAKHKTLIKLRTDFIRELMQSADSLQP
jgi:hypothetical protein